MRIAISSSCLTVIILLLVMIHCSIINKNYRDIEVNGSINDAFLYAADKAYSSYIDYNEADNNMTDDDIINNTMQIFNNAFNNSVSSDGTFTVSLMYTDTEASTLDILITDEYSYGFMNRTGKTTCQRSIQLN